MPSKMLRQAIFTVLILVGLAAVASGVDLAGVFGDHMVLQRDVAVPVWGWADPDETVTVTLGGQTKTATAAADRKWSVRFDALQPGEPLQLQAKGKQNTVAFRDVLVGEVWLCSGQSNMEMTVANVAHKDAEIAAADHPQIRMYCVIDRIPAKEPQARRNGHWTVCSPQTVGKFSATAYFFGRELHKQLDVPVGLINSSWIGTPVQAWTSIKSHEAVPELKPLVDKLRRQEALYVSGKTTEQYERQLAAWKKAAAAAKASGKQFKDRQPQIEDPALSPWAPAAVYNGMIAPLAPYAIRGAIWYQGEANAGSPIYGIQLAAMIANWRDDWKQGDFPFLFVQLPNFMWPQSNPSEPVDGWPLEREQFLKLLDTVKNSGMAVTIDIGETGDIHPHNKQDVGKRLAQWALAKTYGKDVVASGPLYKLMQKHGDKIVLHFAYVGGGLAIQGGGEKLKGFAIAGADKRFVWADAKIVGDTVVVSSPKVAAPVAVRYAWANNPPCNLVNKAGLPASPFRTDDWAQ